MLAVFEKSTGSPPEELGLLINGGAASLSRQQIFTSLPSDSVTFLLPDRNFMAISNDHLSSNTSAVVVDEVFCVFSGNINNLSHLIRHYGLWRQATEAMVLIEAFKVLRDRAPYPPDQVIKDIDGSFSFVVFDANTSSLFVSRDLLGFGSGFTWFRLMIYMDRDGAQPLEWGLASDESLVISNDPKFVTLACGKAQTHFPPGCIFMNNNGLSSFDHLLHKVRAMTHEDEEGGVSAVHFQVDLYRRLHSIPRIGSASNWAGATVVEAEFS